MKRGLNYPNIEAERARNGMSQTELCSLIKVSTQTYQNWQYRHGNIPSSKSGAMAEIFNCSIDYLLQTSK